MSKNFTYYAELAFGAVVFTVFAAVVVGCLVAAIDPTVFLAK